MHHRILQTSILPALALSALVGIGTASAEIRLAPNVVVLTPEDVLERYVTHEEGVDWVRIDGHEPWALTDPDHEIYRDYVPAEASYAAAAWRDVRDSFSERIALTIVCLPRPRAALPNSSAEDNIIYLSPGRVAYDAGQVSFLLAHEMGHCVHRELLRDDDVEGWDRYRRLRGIEDDAVYHDWAVHPDRPREIFAEDFRFLFGGQLANYSGSIENQELPLPHEVPGLEAFMLGLVGETAEAPAASAWDVASLRVMPQPTRGRTSFTVTDDGSLGAGRTLVIADVRGRVLARLGASEELPGVSRFLWDGRVASGGRVGAGVFYANLEGDGPRAFGRIVVVP